MATRNYFQLLAETTPTQFWNDSADPDEIGSALSNGACGVTSNPILITRLVLAKPDSWAAAVRTLAKTMPVEEIPHEVTAQAVSAAADLLLPTYQKSAGRRGFVCAQGNPLNHGNAELMVAEALDFDARRPNIAVKIPVTAAGLEAIEELASRGVTTTCTTSFTVPQVIAIAEACRRGLKRRSSQAANRPVTCFAVIMAGRLDDHLRDEVRAGRGSAREEAIVASGLAVTKRAYQIYKDRTYESVLLVGGMRGHYHVTELAGGNMVLTVAPAMQAAILQQNYTLRNTIEEPVAGELVDELRGVPDFRRAYEPDGMTPAQFGGYGAFVKTQGQFIESYRKLQEFIAQAL